RPRPLGPRDGPRAHVQDRGHEMVEPAARPAVRRPSRRLDRDPERGGRRLPRRSALLGLHLCIRCNRNSEASSHPCVRKEAPMSTATESLRNDYLEQVVRQKSQLENDLKARRAPMVYNPAPAGAQARIAADEIGFDELDRSGGAVGSSAVDVRVSGFWRWKNVVVPPNAYVVHTRRGHEEPVHLGLGVSFRFNPATDSFLVVPSAMQTIIINANCIC